MRFSKWVGGCLLLSGLAGCGGGGGEAVLIPLQSPGNSPGTTASGTTGANSAGTTTNTAATSPTTPAGVSGTPTTGSVDSSGTSSGTTTADASSGTAGSGTTSPGSTPSYAPVVVTAVTAPADGATLSGNVLLKVEGTNIQNAELLPATGYAPRLGVFVVAPDLKSASLVLNTNTIPNGTLSVRISAYNTPPGTSGASEVIAMPARTWRFGNQPPPFGTQEGRAARCQMMGFPYTDPSSDLPVVCVTGTPTSTPPAQCPTHLGTGYGDPEDLLPVLRNATPVAKLYCEPGANGGVVNTGCVCLS